MPPKKVKIIITNDSNDSTSSEEAEPMQTLLRVLPVLYTTDSKGKLRMWKCWVIGDTVHREHGLVDGKHVKSGRVFEGKNIGKKNETSPEEQAWNEANKEWVAHIDKEYAPDKKDSSGNLMLKNLKTEKAKMGGHNINSVSSTGGGSKATKNVSRKKADTCMVDEVEGGPVIPMKAESWELADESDPTSVLPKVSKYFMEVTGKGKNAVTKPTDFYVQPKLDGWRCRVMIQSETNPNEIVMTSNSGKQYPWFASLREAFLQWFSNVEEYGLSDLIDGLDGELYASEFYGEDGKTLDPLIRFSTVCSICALARSEPHLLEDQIQFHCFDIMDKSGTIPQNERFERLDRLFSFLPPSLEKRIVRVETKVLNNIDEVPEVHDEYAEQGYEGIILRALSLKYKVGKRSAEMRKFKYFKDEEYEVVGCKVDKGVSKEHFVWLLKNENGKEFSAKPIGTREQKLDWFANKNKYVGKFLTVKFQEFTEEGIPRFPIAKHFRTGKSVD